MKTLNLKNKWTLKMTVALLALASMISFSAYAGRDGGGGHPIESKFKTLAIRLSAELVAMHPQFRDQLSFSPQLMLAKAHTFNPTCAKTKKNKLTNRSQLEELRDKNKLAYVFPENLNDVVLDCSKQKLAEWAEVEKFTLSSRMKIAHELLRSMGAVTEDAYMQSGSLAVMDQAIRLYQQTELQTLLVNKKNLKCELVAETTYETMVKLTVRLLANGFKVDFMTVNGSLGSGVVDSEMLKMLQAVYQADQAQAQDGNLLIYGPVFSYGTPRTGYYALGGTFSRGLYTLQTLGCLMP